MSPRWEEDGLISSELEAQHVESNAIFVADFESKHKMRTRYQAAVGDRELLHRAMPMHLNRLRQIQLSELPLPTASLNLIEPQRVMHTPHAQPLCSLQTVGDGGVIAAHRAERVQRPERVMCSGRVAAFASLNSSEDAPVLQLPLETASSSATIRCAIYEGHQMMCELDVATTCTLSELASAISGCRTCAQLAKQHADLRQRAPDLLANHPLPTLSRAFCIEDAWYVDGDVDLSRQLRSWLLSRGNAPPALALMAETRISDLRLRIGRQYLFVHHGDCEHAVVFLSCWLTNLRCSSATCHAASSAARLVYSRRVPQITCSVCLRSPAVWEVYGDKLADVAPCNLCQMCHFQYHYTAAGSAQRTDYRVYPVVAPRKG